MPDKHYLYIDDSKAWPGLTSFLIEPIMVNHAPESGVVEKTYDYKRSICFDDAKMHAV